MSCPNEQNPMRCLAHRRESFAAETPARPSSCVNCKVGRAREAAAAKRRKRDGA
jgi:hypothetical protein